MATQVVDTDSEDLFAKGDDPDDSVPGFSPGSSIFKIALFIFILFIVINSDVFIDKILSSDDNTFAEGRHATAKGTFVQGLIISIGYICLHMLVSTGYL